MPEAQVGTFITKNVENLYTFILWLVSLFLWHPALVQLVLLFLLLFGIYRVARFVGARRGGA